jgi:hypothetical protein
MKKAILFVILFSTTFTTFGQRRLTPIVSKEARLNEEYCTGFFKTPEGTYFDFSDEILQSSAMGHLNIVDWLQGRVAGLQVFKTRYNVSIPLIRNQLAAIYVDEMPVGIDGSSFISIADIAMIKVVKDPMVAGWRGPGGAILIYRWRGEDESEEE